ncbi:hypothetical protein AMTRI_Chr06g177530 [Amborella trichopoda]
MEFFLSYKCGCFNNIWNTHLCIRTLSHMIGISFYEYEHNMNCALQRSADCVYGQYRYKICSRKQEPKLVIKHLNAYSMPTASTCLLTYGYVSRVWLHWSLLSSQDMHPS